MSRDELSRLVGDALADPDMIRDAMAIKDLSTMEAYVSGRGYELTPEELAEIWDMTSRVLSGEAEPMSAARWRIDASRGEHPVTPD